MQRFHGEAVAQLRRLSSQIQESQVNADAEASNGVEKPGNACTFNSMLASGPAISEEVKYGGLLFSSKDSFCGIFSYAHHVTLEFSRGARLPDPHAVLEGSGKIRRHIKLLSPADIEGKHVAKYVEMARQAADG